MSWGHRPGSQVKPAAVIFAESSGAERKLADRRGFLFDLQWYHSNMLPPHAGALSPSIRPTSSQDERLLHHRVGDRERLGKHRARAAAHLLELSEGVH